MSTTTDLSQFGFRELRMAAELLTAYCNSKPDWLSDGVTVMMNTLSGNVFLTDEDFNVGMINGDELEPFLSTPYEGHEGFISDLVSEHKPNDLNADDVDYIRDWAERTGFDLPKEWTPEDDAE